MIFPALVAGLICFGRIAREAVRHPGEGFTLARTFGAGAWGLTWLTYGLNLTGFPAPDARALVLFAIGWAGSWLLLLAPRPRLPSPCPLSMAIRTPWTNTYFDDTLLIWISVAAASYWASHRDARHGGADAALAASPDLRRRMGEAGRRVVAQRYCLDVTTPTLARLLREAAGVAS